MSATTPIEYTFDKLGTLKNTRELSNLKLTTRPAIKPVFANTGQIVQKAFAGKGTLPGAQSGANAGRVGPLNPMPRTMASIESGSTLTPLPRMVMADPNRQGDDAGGGMVVPEAVAKDLQAGGAMPGAASRGQKDLGGNKKILVFGGIGVAAIIVIYYLFFAKGKGRKGKKRGRRRLY